MTHQTIAQGAEAKIILTTPHGAGGRDTATSQKAFIIKDRIPKSYRIKELDEKIRKRRTKSEAKLLTKASEIISSPKPFFMPQSKKIKMPFIQGQKLSEHLDSFPLIKQKQICKQIGESIAKLHDEDIIHGDLTTSNMIYVPAKGDDGKKEHLPAHSHSQINKTDNKKSSPLINSAMTSKASVYFIDFGLGFISHKFEDKAVDLHLLKQALEAKHFKNWEELVTKVLEGYEKSKDYKIVLERLKAVEKRGRYKHQ